MGLKCLVLALLFLPIQMLSQCLKADIVFALDWSGSEDGNGRYITEAAIDFISSLNLGPSSVKVGIIPFNDFPIKQWCVPLTENKEILIGALSGLGLTSPDGGTEYESSILLAEKFYQSSQILRDEEVIKILIIISDGEEIGFEESEVISQILKSNGCAIWCIGTGTDPLSIKAKNHLIEISSGPEFFFEETYFLIKEELMRLDLCP